MATAQDIFDRILPRMTQEPPVQGFLSAIGHVIKHIDTRLFTYGSELLRSVQSLEFAVGASSADLPSGLMGFKTQPRFLSGDTVTKLWPLPEELRWRLDEDGDPKYYEVMGNTITLYPTPEVAGSIKFVAMVKNTVTTMAHTIPYGGLFDDMIAELALKYSSSPIMATVDQAIAAFVAREMDVILLRRTKKNIYFKFSL